MRIKSVRRSRIVESKAKSGSLSGERITMPRRTAITAGDERLAAFKFLLSGGPHRWNFRDTRGAKPDPAVRALARSDVMNGCQL